MSYSGRMTDLDTITAHTWISPQELAELLNVHLRTIYRYLENGTVTSAKVGGRHKINVGETLTKLGLI